MAVRFPGGTGSVMIGLRFGRNRSRLKTGGPEPTRKRQTILRRGMVVTRPGVNRSYLEKLEAVQRQKDLKGVAFKSVLLGTLSNDVLKEYDEHKIGALLARCSANAAAMELEQEAELFS